MTPPPTPGSSRETVHRLTRRGLLVVLSAPLLALGIGGTPAHATFPGSNGRIVFDTADSPDGSQIYSVNPDGSDLLQLTHLRHGAAAFMPRWSANGRRIAYVSNVSGNDELWTMRWNGRGKQQITDEPGVGHFWPTWTPDGAIVFQRCDFTAFGTCTISIVRRDGSDMRVIVAGHWHHGQPAVSPDGDWIVFTSDKGGYDGRLWLVRPDGTGMHLVGEPPVLFADRPDWAPDGSMITFTGEPRFGRVYFVAPDGTGLHTVTGDTPQIFGVLSPDGTRMVLLHDVECDCRALRLADTEGHLLGTVTSLPGVTFSDWGVAA
jgi:TolB protein